MTTNPSSQAGPTSGSLGFRERTRFQRVVTVAGISGALILVAALAWILYAVAQKEQSKSWAADRFGLRTPVKNALHKRYKDENQDLIADPPAAEACIHPDVLRFAYIPDANTPPDVASWQPFLDRLSEKIGVPVEYYAVEDVAQQLAAIKTGDLHLAGLNTGSVPQAVNACGFVPISVKAESEGNWSVRMKFITPAKSPIKKVTDVRHGYFTFTNNNSNSGCKLAIVTLLREFNMLLGKDYDYRFSTSHDESIRLVKTGEVELAAVASDMLERAIESGAITNEDFREVYASPPIPAAAFGYCYHLAPDLAAKVRESLVGMDVSDTPIAGPSAGAKPASLVAIDYKKDFAAIRDVDDMLGRKHDVEILDTYDAAINGPSSESEETTSALAPTATPASTDPPESSKPGDATNPGGTTDGVNPATESPEISPP